jgi:hypothetical protein
MTVRKKKKRQEKRRKARTGKRDRAAMTMCWSNRRMQYWLRTRSKAVCSMQYVILAFDYKVKTMLRMAGETRTVE